MMMLSPCAVACDVLSAVLSILNVRSRTRAGSLAGNQYAVLVVVVDRENCWKPKKTKVAP